MLKHKLAGHAIDPDTFLHDGVLRFDHSAVLRDRKPSSSVVITSHTSMNLSGDQAFVSSAFQRRQHACSHCRNSNPNEQLVSALGPIFQSMHLTVPELQCSGPSINRLARI